MQMEIAESPTLAEKVCAKITMIRETGRFAYLEGTPKFFAGFPASLVCRAHISFLGSFGQSGEAIMWRINRAARFAGLPVILAGLDFPVHCTMLEAESFDTVALKELLPRLETSVRNILPSLNEFGLGINFSDLLLDANGSILLMANEIPERVVLFRQRLAEVYNEYGLRVKLMDDILHMTLGRLSVPPSGKVFSSGALEIFHHMIADSLTESVQKEGLTLNIEKLYVGQASVLLASKPK